MNTPSQTERLRKALPKCLRLPLHVDQIDNDNGGQRFKAYAIFDADGRAIFDTLNADHMAVEIMEEGDEDGVQRWDEEGRQRAEFFVAVINALSSNEEAGEAALAGAWEKGREALATIRARHNKMSPGMDPRDKSCVQITANELDDLESGYAVQARGAAPIAAWVRKWKDDNMDRLGREARWELDDVADGIERGDWKSTPVPSVNGTDEPPNALAWRCFHCDEVFTDEAAATAHFGPSCTSTAYCQLTAEQVRGMEQENERYRAEDGPKDRQILAMADNHRRALILAEEDGYTKGVADMKAQGYCTEPAAHEPPNAILAGVREDAERRDSEKSAMVDKAIASASYKAGTINERKRIVAILERDPKLRYIAALVDTASAPFDKDAAALREAGGRVDHVERKSGERA